MRRAKQQSHLKFDIWLGLTFWAVAVVLNFTSTYFGSWTPNIAIGCAIIGTAAVGVDLDKVNDTKCFSDLGFGSALSLLWIVLAQLSSSIWIRILLFVLLLLGLSGVFKGIIGIYELATAKTQLPSSAEVNQTVQNTPAKPILQYVGTLIVFIMCCGWFYNERGFEPLIGIVGTFLTFAGFFTIPKKYQIGLLLLLFGICIIGLSLIPSISHNIFN